MKNTKNTNTVRKFLKFNRKIIERYNIHIKIMLQDMDSSSDLIDHRLFISNIHRHGPFIYIFTHHGPFIYIFTHHGPFILYIHRPWTLYVIYSQTMDPLFYIFTDHGPLILHIHN